MQTPKFFITASSMRKENLAYNRENLRANSKVRINTLTEVQQHSARV
jgi:hypothetical protein